MIEMAGNGGSSYIQAVNNAMLGGAVDVGGDSAYLILDTRRFSQFSVTDFTMHHRYGTGNVANPTTPISAAKMRVVDSTGLSFMNFLMDIMRTKIQSTRASAFFLLTITFHGHTDDSPEPHTETVATCFIPMILTSLHFEFTNTGTIFDIEFWEVEGNPGGAVPQLVDLGDIQAVSTEKTSNTLGGILQSLEDRLNIRSLQFYQKYTNEAYERATAEDKKNFDKAGKLVQYMITVPDEWKNFRINSAGKSANVEQVFLAKASKTPDKDPKQVEQEKTVAAPAPSGDRASYYSFSQTTDVPMAIKIMLESCKEYLDLASEEKKQKGQATVHRTIVSITSDANTYMIHFDIYPYFVPKVDEKKNTVATGDGKTQKRLTNGDIKNLIKYDYLFSGRNEHVLDLKVDFAPTAAVALDMDLSIGQTRLAENASTGQKQKEVKENGQSKTVNDNPLIRKSEPIFPPLKTKDQQTNFGHMSTEEYKKEEAQDMIKAKQQHTNTMALLHFVASLQAQLTVRGNPNIIRKYADRNLRGGIARHPATISSPDTLRSLRSGGSAESTYNGSIKSRMVSEKALYYTSFVKPRIEEDKAKQNGTDPLLHGDDIATTPLYCMVNIYAPNTDFLGNQTDGGMFTNKFFYDGVYMVLQIETQFSGGTFRHVMNLMPYDLDGSFSKSTEAIK
jgi:hypothetical protein